MAEERYQCPLCEKYFGSEETFSEHARIEHDTEAVDMEEDDPLLDVNGLMAKIRYNFNRSFLLGLVLGLVVSGAAFSGYTYWESLDHRVEVPVTVVTCDDCSYGEFQNATDRLFNAEYRQVDYQSSEGQELVEKYDLQYIPAFIFDPQVKEAEDFYKVEPVMIEYEDAYVILDRGNLVAQRLSEGIELEE